MVFFFSFLGLAYVFVIGWNPYSNAVYLGMYRNNRIVPTYISAILLL